MMKLPAKILTLRKQRGMSQEDLAEKLHVSRQAVSRWELGSAQPDASNILQLSKLFGVSADYLLNDDYEADDDGPAIKADQPKTHPKVKKMIGLCTITAGLLGNFVIYVLSRVVKVMVPRVMYEAGRTWYHWSSEWTDYSYKYFIREYHLELLTAAFWILAVAGFLIAFWNREKVKVCVCTLQERVTRKKHRSAE